VNIIAMRDVEKGKPSIATFVKAYPSDAGERTHHWASLSATAEDLVP
jgi:hypothetical protein